MKGILVVFVLALAGNYLIDRFVIKDPGDESDTGFIEAKPGFGTDDAAKALGLALIIVFGGKFARKLIGG